MAFSRDSAPPLLPDRDALTSAMVGIGMAFAAPAQRDPNLENTLLFASRMAMEDQDPRVLDVLITWFGVHAPFVNADRLTRLVAAQDSSRVRALWAALARWQEKDRRFARLAASYKGPRIEVLATGSVFQIKRHGEDPRFVDGPLRVPGNLLRGRAADVLTPSQLARHQRAYRARVMMGPVYRADMWAALEKEPSLTPAELARQTYGSFATAWHVRRDFELVGPTKRGIQHGRGDSRG